MADVSDSLAPLSARSVDARERASRWIPESDDLLRAPGRAFVVPPLEDNQVVLKAVTAEDQLFLRLVETSSELAPRWRFRGATPAPEQWAQATWGAALAQFLVLEKPHLQPVGIVCVFQASFQDGHARVDAAKFDLASRATALMHGLGLFLDYVFSCWDFRKLYMEVPEHAFGPIASGLDDAFVLEGRLREHSFSGGERWDHLLLALYRERWQSVRRGLRERGPRARAELERFAAEVAAIAGVPEGTVTPDVRPIADLGLDSLAVAELAALLDAGAAPPLATAIAQDGWSRLTVAQLFEACGGRAAG